MSTKGHFIYENGIEGYEETSEPQSIFGNFTGYNAYLIIESFVLKSIKIKDEFLYVKTKNTEHLPEIMKIWGGAIIEMDYDVEDGLLIILKGGHHITKKIISREFPV